MLEWIQQKLGSTDWAECEMCHASGVDSLNCLGRLDAVRDLGEDLRSGNDGRRVLGDENSFIWFMSSQSYKPLSLSPTMSKRNLRKEHPL